MPYLDIRITAPCLPETVEKLATRLTDLTADLLVKRREVTATTVQCIQPGHWHVGGSPLMARGASSINIEVNVTAGTNDATQKSEFVAAAYAAAESILGRLEPASYIIVREIPADAWGYAGITQAARAAQKLRPSA